MKRRTSSLFLPAILVTIMWFLYSCQANSNPDSSTSGTNTAPVSGHTVNFGGHQHAEGYCQATEDCTTCHGPNLEGNGTRPACTTCHSALWNNANCGTGKSTHNVSLGSKLHQPNYCTPYQNCKSCHGQDLRGGTNGEPSCIKCHTQTNWKNCGTVQHNKNQGGVQHAMDNRKPMQDCTPCHGVTILGGYNNEPSCYKCHGSIWEGNFSGHTVTLGGKSHRPNYCTPYQNCTSCHGQDLRGGTNGEPSCLKCHTQNKWKNCGTVQHNKREDGVLHAMDNEKPERDCTPCHGVNLRGGLNNESSCYKCHGKKW
jgi:hypothetical protein